MNDAKAKSSLSLGDELVARLNHFEPSDQC
jgi:hypothetical protein